MAISLRRPSARANSRLPTLAQAISSTSATAREQHRPATCRTSPTISFLQRHHRRAPAGVGLADIRCSSRVEISVHLGSRLLDVDAGLQPRDRPGRCDCRARRARRPCTRAAPRSRAGRRPTPRPRTRAGITPTIVYASPSSVSVRPMTSGAPPRCCFQNPSLRMTTCDRAGAVLLGQEHASERRPARGRSRRNRRRPRRRRPLRRCRRRSA